VPLVRRAFQQVDVFAAGPYSGNPVAVVLDGSGLTEEQMLRFTRWTNLSEATFLLPPSTTDADYRVRIFTAGTELPFAGHPTLGSCHAWLLAAGAGPRHEIVQECAAGLVRLRTTEHGLAFAAPATRRTGPVDEPLLRHIAELLRIDRREIADAQWADNGPGWVAVLLESADAVLALRPGPVDLAVGVVGRYPDGYPHAVEVRAFFPGAGGSVEDPVTGSLNASLAQWLVATGRVSPPYVASQGTVLGREGRVHVSQDSDGTLWIGGGTATWITGQVELGN
jgi:PhzF family phenazine biosynthesis protein